MTKKINNTIITEITTIDAANFLIRLINEINTNNSDTITSDSLFKLGLKIENALHTKQVAQNKENANNTKKQKKKYDLTAYTDGCYSTRTEIGAGAFILLRNDTILKKGGQIVKNACCNTAELTGVKRLIDFLPQNASVIVNTDSQYVITCLSNNANNKKNQHLIAQIKKLISAKNIKISYNWIKGHSGNTYNEMSDQLCKEIVKCQINNKQTNSKKK